MNARNFSLLRILGIALAATLIGACMNETASGRREALFNDGWKFHKGDTPAAKDATFSDTDWRDVQLPHDWSIEGPFSQEWASGQGYLPGGIAWYRKSFDIPPGDQGKRVYIRFDGVYKNAQVWCNGKPAGGRPYGYMSFTLDLTPLVQFGAKNELAVRVDHSEFADSRWYTGSGIYRNVHLLVTDPVHVDTWGTFVTTPEVTADAAGVSVVTTVVNDGTAADVSLTNIITDETGREVARATDAQAIPANKSAAFNSRLQVAHPALWSVDHPTLYTVRTQVKAGGRLVDAYDTPFGIRTFRFDPDKGFFLNGQNMKLKGVCFHEDAGALGAAIPIQVWQRRLDILREAGCNAIRTSHNPPTPEFLDLCDKMGFLVMDEAFDEWSGGKNKWIAGRNRGTPAKFGYSQIFEQWADIDVRDMVLRDRNHPSIIMWSIGNEIDYLNDPWRANAPELPVITARLMKAVKAVDTTRPVTAACAAVGTNTYTGLLDIAGYNYQEQRYAADHAAFPKRIIYGSENSQNLQAWTAVTQNDYISGQFLWTGIDFIGEAGAWPNRGSGSGFLDLAGFKKTRFYQRQAMWSEKPMIYLDANARGITCYSNCDTVAVYHDGTLLGEQTITASRTATGNFSFTTGTLKAVGKKSGIEVCTFELAALGPAKKLRILPDVTSLTADGRDLAQIEVNVTDDAGHRIPDAAQQITCAIQGPARLLGIENGDQSSHESYQSPSHKAYQGRMLVYLQATKNPGPITFSVTAPGLEPASVALYAK